MVGQIDGWVRHGVSPQFSGHLKALSVQQDESSDDHHE
jgi:hypothetical protein